MPRALIFVNGELPDFGATRTLIQPGDVILAADGGARHAQALGLTPETILGDFDSLTQAELEVFSALGVRLLRFPIAKDETDLELALNHACQAGYNPILIIGANGGRLDQALGNLSLLGNPAYRNLDLRLDDGQTEVFLITSQALIHGAAGETLSLIPWGNPAEGVSTEGLVFPLNQETLLPYRTRGLSNQMLTETAKVSLKHGQLLCVHIRKNSL